MSNENVLELENGDGSTTLRIYLKSLNCTLIILVSDVQRSDLTVTYITKNLNIIV